MSTSKASTDGGNGRDVDAAPLHAPGQLPDAPPVGGSASGSGGADGSEGNSPGKAEGESFPHIDPDHAVEEPAHVEEPPTGRRSAER
ncbi:hypothetical protein PF005_g4368 [Phytophthora fragariae]|uniref:Uncharacterized protein n=1 Tax=Phytophthora fragariae TaxID=53985 RepID=A0A6A3S3V1_9STRA|nr:hypothetical protein PF003_g16341 [Phytophthora fragariae]KAE8936878.1 hypothetical protein PF009_g13196 [Phytophthora fragariae]KAE9008154.1 hypothetical protein PF011_g10808 [Phytophthora fragariae]KAE9093348.1 hypothetical protein PF010_g17511 [Phytophthora fragariae]KAE9109151.1 hypothetical protein PF007_g12358 [Phytophthora fragariae]